MTKPCVPAPDFKDAAPPWQLSLLDGFTSSVAATVNDLATYCNFAQDTSTSANNIVVNYPAGITASYGAGLEVTVKLAHTNTTNGVTLNVNGQGAILVHYQDGALPPAGSLVAGSVYTFVHDGTFFELDGNPSAIFPGSVFISDPTFGNWQWVVNPSFGELQLVSPSNGPNQTTASFGLSGQGIVLGNNTIITQFLIQAQKVGFFNSGGAPQTTVTGSKGGNAALASLITALAATGLIVDGTT